MPILKGVPRRDSKDLGGLPGFTADGEIIVSPSSCFWSQHFLLLHRSPHLVASQWLHTSLLRLTDESSQFVFKEVLTPLCVYSLQTGRIAMIGFLGLVLTEALKGGPLIG